MHNHVGYCPKCDAWNDGWSFINTCENCGVMWMVTVKDGGNVFVREIIEEE